MTVVADLEEYCTVRNVAAIGPKASGPQLKQPMFNWSAQNKYDELKNFKRWLETFSW